DSPHPYFLLIPDTCKIEGHIDEKLSAGISAFSMETFLKMMVEREDEITGDVFDMLMTLGEFSEFRNMMLAHKAG
ncbi:unnamed protein product, partial [Choristocarpus tenellus]